MSAYSALADLYDELTKDVPYEAYADFYQSVFSEHGGANLILDLGCGTGTLSVLLAERGFEVIGVDGSADMLTVAMEKADDCSATHKPLFICQAAERLDLYGTVDAVYSSLDSVNYIKPQTFSRVLKRLRLFLRPGGVFLFDLRTSEFLRSMDGSISVDEGDGFLCMWRGSFNEENDCLSYGLDLFTQQGDTWQRSFEEHFEYNYDLQTLSSMLSDAGFTDFNIRTDGPMGGAERIYITAVRGV